MLSDDMAMLCSVVTKRFVHCSIAPHGAAVLSGRGTYEVPVQQRETQTDNARHTHISRKTQ